MPVVFWKVYDGKTIDPKTGRPEKRFVLRYYTLFHVSQCDGLEIDAATEETESTIDPIATCETIAVGYKNPPTVRHGGERAYYAHAGDVVGMPERSAFEGAAEYYSTLFHEFGHSTGAAHRLNRKGVATVNAFGSHEYSFEELVAECTAAFLCAEAGISAATIENQAAYVANWARKLKSESRWIIDAAAQASKAADMILGRNPNSAAQDETDESL